MVHFGFFWWFFLFLMKVITLVTITTPLVKNIIPAELWVSFVAALFWYTVNRILAFFFKMSFSAKISFITKSKPFVQTHLFLHPHVFILNLTIRYFPELFVHQLCPSEPSWSSSRNVCPYVFICLVPFSCYFFRSLIGPQITWTSVPDPQPFFLWCCRQI